MDAILYSPERLTWDKHEFRCAIGRTGLSAVKREGDGATPIGNYPFRRLLYRPDRIDTPCSQLEIAAIEPDDGWCDDPAHADYNQQILRPFDAGHERLWREDHLYDLVLVIGHNDAPPVPGAGSAIFMHVAGVDYPPTEGCVALALEDLLKIVGECSATTTLQIIPPPT